MGYNKPENYKNNGDDINKGLIHFKEEGLKNNRYAQYNQLKNSENSNTNTNSHNTNSESGKNRFIFFNKDEYNKAYNSGKGLTDQINNNLNINVKESNSTSNRKIGNTNEIEDKNNYQLSTIKNENVNSNNTEIAEEEKKNYIGQMSEDSYNIIKNLQNQDLITNEKFNENNQMDNEGENVRERPKNEN